MQDVRAEYARQTKQQMQSLQETLQKGIANVITGQFMLVFVEVTAL